MWGRYGKSVGTTSGDAHPARCGHDRSGDNPKIGSAKSIVDYVFRWLERKFITGEQGELFRALPMPFQPATGANGIDPVGALGEMIQMGDAPACNICGSLMVRSGTCYRCGTCGATSGCS
jgi:ribonucleoside-diphosphate reductase alpha chain